MVINSVEGIGLTALAIGAGAATIPIVVESCIEPYFGALRGYQYLD